jgi:hypothetical protein
VLDVDLLATPQGVASGGRDTQAEFWGHTEYTLKKTLDSSGRLRAALRVVPTCAPAAVGAAPPDAPIVVAGMARD